VDRPFIVTVGGRSSDAMEAFYGGPMGLRVMDRLPFYNGILAAGCGVAPDTVFPTSVARIPGRSFLVEMDEYPPHIAERPRAAGALPAGMALVSFHVRRLDAVPVAFRAPVRPLPGHGYAGRRTGVIMGAAGEWLELIETEPPGD
jgi:catechol 2,3-dioxygenase-like lactoylglutathione lyase family enzyme